MNAARGDATVRPPHPPEVRFGFSSPPGLPLEEDWAALAESLGASVLLMGEGPAFFADPWLHLAAVARQTSRLRLGTGVTMPGLRHPAVLAQTLATLQVLSGGRAVLGIGTGDFGVRNLGMRPASLDELESYALAVKDLCRGTAVDLGGHEISLRTEVAETPLWLAAEGPRSLRLAGRIADGVIVSNGARADQVRHVMATVASGAREADRDPAEIEVWFLVRVDVGSAAESGVHREPFSEYGARLANFLIRSTAPHRDPERARAQLFERKGLDLTIDEVETLQEFHRRFDDSESYRTSSANVALMRSLELTELIGDLFFVAGNDETVLNRLTELRAAGAANLCVPQVELNRLETTAQVAELLVRAAEPLRVPTEVKGGIS